MLHLPSTETMTRLPPTPKTVFKRSVGDSPGLFALIRSRSTGAAFSANFRPIRV